MFCKKCGRETNNPSNVCNECIHKEIQFKKTNFEDKGGFKYGLLGFLFPISGIVLYYMLRKKEPNLSDSFKIGAIASFVLFLLLLIFVFSMNIIML